VQDETASIGGRLSFRQYEREKPSFAASALLESEPTCIAKIKNGKNSLDVSTAHFTNRDG
jgi:hypothetical protein